VDKHSKVGIKKGHCRRHGELNDENSIVCKERYGIRIRCKICRRENQAILEFNRRNGIYKDRRFLEKPSICEEHGREKNRDNYYTCDICANERHRKKYKEDITERRTKAVLQQLKHTNLTREMYEEMFEKQKGLCEICNRPETRKGASGDVSRLAVDHCHRSLKIRGLLCHDCNTGLGKFYDDITLLKKAIEYLKEHEAQ